jgi:shikimate kinase
VFFRDRALSAIVGENHEGRPLIGEDKQRIYRLYDQRIGLYQKYAQYTISNTDTVEEAAEQIAQLYRKECGQ